MEKELLTVLAIQEAAGQARDWIAEHPNRRPISAGRMVAILTNALAAAPQPPRQPLTDEAEHQCPYPKANPSTRNAWLDGWKAAERAHGIGGVE